MSQTIYLGKTDNKILGNIKNRDGAWTTSKFQGKRVATSIAKLIRLGLITAHEAGADVIIYKLKG